MTEDTGTKNRRIARNTLLLYMRSFVTLIISLYTSRLILRELGVDDYGVYNVVGGFVAMFSIITGPIAGAISRFLTFGIGKGDDNETRKVFSTCINLQLILSGVVLLLGETLGVWFLTHKLNIPANSMVAAHWVLQCSIITAILGLINIPYSSAIIAHEKMDVYAYVSIYDAVMKMGLALLLIVLPFNSLIAYSVGIVIILLTERIYYGVYCSRKFSECHYMASFDKKIFKEMSGYAGWTFLGSTASLFNTQGVGILMNIFFGVVVNTAKGISAQVEAAMMTLVNSFTTAFTPQITKSYAEGNKDYMFSLMCRGTKFSMYLILLIIIPLEFETATILRLWLGEVPEYAVAFTRLSLLCTAIVAMGTPFLQGLNATGKIRNYQIAVTAVGVSVFPLTWLAYKLGLSVETFYWIYLIVYNILIWLRMWFVKQLLGFKISVFAREVFWPVCFCAALSIIPAILIWSAITNEYLRLIVLTVGTLICTSLIVLYFGMTYSERNFILSKIRSVIPFR